MPIYEYACRKCDHIFEALVQDAEGVECPRCHAEQLERLLSLPARPVTGPATSPCQADPSLPPCGPMCRRL
jgi:putative FmdB family regulatory protein